MSTVLTLFPDDDRFRSPKATRIYFGLSNNEPHLVKIGLTRRAIGHRGGELHFTELCHIEGDRFTEANYHRKYDAERIGRTEWFKISNRLLMDLITMCVGQHRAASVEVLKAIIYSRLRGPASS